MKDKNTWKEWLQIGSNMAILIGILLVIWELQQTRILTRAQLASDSFLMQAEFANKLMGESPSVVLEKACLHPEELTTHDKIILSQIIRSHFLPAIRSARLEDISNIGIQSNLSFTRSFEAMFNYEYGREYFQRMKERGGNEEVLLLGEQILASNRPSDCSIGTIIPGGF